MTVDMEDVKLAFASGRYGDCIKILRGTLKRNGEPLDIKKKVILFCNLAFCHLHLELYRKAVNYCDDALSIDPQSVRAHLYKGKALVKLGKKHEALKLFEDGLKESDDLQYSAELLTCIKMIQEEVRPPECNGTQNGTVQHENASVQHENASVQHENASVGKSMLKPKYSTEVALLVKQSKENPGDENPSETHVTLLKDDACAASLTSVHSMVEEVCKGRNMKVVVQDVKNGGEPENVDVDVDLKIRLGFVLVNEENYADAIMLFNAILHDDPGNIKALVGRGSAKAMDKDIKGGEEDFCAAIYVEPDVAEAWKRRGQVRVAMGKYQQALADFERAQVLLMEEDMDIQKEIGLVYQNTGDYEKALNYLHKAEAMVESLDEMDAVVAKATWNAMGLAYNAQGQPLEAIKTYSKALRLYPDFKEANVNIAQSYKDLALLSKALHHFDKGLSLDTTCVLTMNLKGVCEHNSGLIQEAFNTYSKAIVAQSDHRDSRYMHGVCAHGLGRLRTAVSSYDTMLELLPGHFVFYLRQMALYMWRQMDAPLDCFNLDNDMHPCFKEMWTKRLNPDCLPDDFSPEEVREDLGDLGLLQDLSADALDLVKTAHHYGKKMQYNSVGFLTNIKQQRWAGLAILDMAQTVAWLWQAMRKGDVDGCTVSGKYSSISKPHAFGWRDAFDVPVRWRQLSEPLDSVWWIDLLNPEAFAEGFGSQTPMIQANSRVVRYYPYFLPAFKLLKEHMETQCNLTPDQIKLTRTARTCDQLHQVMDRDFYVVLPCPSHAIPDRVMEGTRLTIQRVAGYKYSCTIRTPCTPSRWAVFDEELMEAWHRLCDTVTAGKSTDIDQLVDSVLVIAYYWYNMMPLTRGSAACGLVCMQSLLLAAGYDITAPVPEGIQWDWEAILLGSPEKFIKAARLWIIPSLKTTETDFLSNIPCVSSTFSTIRDVINVLNYRLPGELEEVTMETTSNPKDIQT